MSSATQNDDVVIDFHLLRQSFVTVRRRWLRAGIAAFVIVTVAALVLVPQQYKSTATVVLQQPGVGGEGMSVLALATGSNASKRYIGVIKSRERAEDVVNRLHIQRIFHLRTFHKATVFMQKHVDAEDNATTGLLEISVTLPGPPVISLNHRARRKLVANTAADAANAYVDELRSYYINNDNDRESVLVRHADIASAQARADYEEALQNITNFETSLGHTDPRSLPTPASTSNVSPAAQEISTLYGDLTKVEGQLTALQASVATQRQLASRTLSNLGSVPSEDPLLQYARNQVSADKAQLANLQVTYGPDHPSVILARNKIIVDERALDAQTRGVVNNRTTTQEQELAQIQSLIAQKALLNAQITSSAKRLRTNRDLSVVLARLQTELEIRLQVLQATLSEAAKIGLENASVESKVTTIDTAEPADSGSPSGLLIIILTAVFFLVVYAAAAVWHYFRQAALAQEGTGS